MFGFSFLSRLRSSRNVEPAIGGLDLRWGPPPVAGPDEIDAHLDAFFDHVLALTAPGRNLSNLDEALAHACARAEEWTA